MGRPRRFSHSDPEVQSCVTLQLKHEYDKKYRQQKRQQGIQSGCCIKCHRERIGETKLCEKHWFQDRAKCRLGATKYANQLKELLEQQEYKCFYTGRKMVIGVNASLDHLLSVKNHPEKKGDINNVLWCCSEINLMKNGMNKDEFIETCRLIGERF
jgi:hypothetical protein